MRALTASCLQQRPLQVRTSALSRYLDDPGMHASAMDVLVSFGEEGAAAAIARFGEGGSVRQRATDTLLRMGRVTRAPL